MNESVLHSSFFQKSKPVLLLRPELIGLCMGKEAVLEETLILGPAFPLLLSSIPFTPFPYLLSLILGSFNKNLSNSVLKGQDLWRKKIKTQKSENWLKLIQESQVSLDPTHCPLWPVIAWPVSLPCYHVDVPYLLSSRLYKPTHFIVGCLFPQLSNKWICLLFISVTSLKKPWLSVSSPELSQTRSNRFQSPTLVSQKWKD